MCAPILFGPFGCGPSPIGRTPRGCHCSSGWKFYPWCSRGDAPSTTHPSGAAGQRSWWETQQRYRHTDTLLALACGEFHENVTNNILETVAMFAYHRYQLVWDTVGVFPLALLSGLCQANLHCHYKLNSAKLRLILDPLLTCMKQIRLKSWICRIWKL